MATFSSIEFLTAVFHPKKAQALPGLRRRSRVGKKWNNRRRLAFNKMPAKNQEILRRSGKEEDYLRGEATLKDAKDVLRIEAIKEGVAKAPKQKTVQTTQTTAFELGMHLLGLAMMRPASQDEKADINISLIQRNSRFLVETHPYLVPPLMDIHTYVEFMKFLGSRDARAYDYDDDSMSYLWYH